jgi:hypothetical protein
LVVIVCIVVESRGVRIGRGRSAGSGSEDELGSLVADACNEEHVGGCAVEQGIEYIRGLAGAVVSEDAFLGYSAGDLDSGETGDLPKDLIEAGVGG